MSVVASWMRRTSRPFARQTMRYWRSSRSDLSRSRVKRAYGAGDEDEVEEGEESVVLISKPGGRDWRGAEEDAEAPETAVARDLVLRCEGAAMFAGRLADLLCVKRTAELAVACLVDAVAVAEAEAATRLRPVGEIGRRTPLRRDRAVEWMSPSIQVGRRAMLARRP